jgi:cytochrome c oxidase subunit 4
MSGHVVPTRVYYTIFALLMLGTYLTVQAAYLDLGPMNSAVALVIAVTKAVLVVLYFMHVKYSPRLTVAVVVGSVFWLAILVAITYADYVTRAWRTFG